MPCPCPDILFSHPRQTCLRDVERRSYAKLSNIGRLRANAKIPKNTIRDMLFADDPAVTGHMTSCN